MLTNFFGSISFSVFVGLFVSGCLKDEIRSNLEHVEANGSWNPKVSLTLNQAQIRDNGILELSVMYVNESSGDVCIAQRTIDNSYRILVDIFSPTNGMSVLGNDDDEFLGVTDDDLSQLARIRKVNRTKSIVVSQKDRLHVKEEMPPIHGAYFADSKNVYVKGYTQGTQLSVVVETLFYDCKEKDPHKAWKAGRAISVKSSALKLVGNVEKFIR